MRRLKDIVFRGKTYKSFLWEGEEESVPSNSRLCGLDTETELIKAGQVPPVVTMQVAYPFERVIHSMTHEYVFQYLHVLERKSNNIQIMMHNAGFDCAVLGWKRNRWLSKKLEKGEIVDTGMRFYLKRLADGVAPEMGYPSLQVLARSLFNVKIDKDDDIRLTYKRGMDLTEDHLNYGALDPVVTAEVALAIPDKQATEIIQTLTTITTGELQRNGMLVDKERFQLLKRKFNIKLQESVKLLSVFGYMPGVSGNQKVLQDILETVEKREGVKFKRTAKTKKISTRDDYLIGVDVNHPFLDAYKEYVHLNKMVKTYLNEDLIGKDGRVHPYFNPIVQTGRTSCSGPNIQNVPGDEGLRGQYIAPPGKVILAIDYDQIELCALAESNYVRFGESKQGDRINEGLCIHVDMASELYNEPYEELYKKYLDGDPATKKKRAAGKVPNFGYPGGMGPPSMLTFAHGFGIDDMTIEKAIQGHEAWFEKNPEMKKHMQPSLDPYWTERNIREYCSKHNIKLYRHTEQELKNALYDKFRAAIKEGNLPKDTNLGRKVFEELKYLIRYRSVTIQGRVRSNCTFCSALNSVFQGLTADGCKLALWYLVKNGYKIINFIHDEVLIELDDDENLQYHVTQCEKLMLNAMKQIIKRVNIGVGSTLMTRWNKAAKAVYDEDNNLITAADNEVLEEVEDLPPSYYAEIF